ncbi:hypothetical protein N7537_001724 [Penicillium hordei]|uniref:Uncharacterized protein n=1 Tax=Penicillium hordei TaxID=40994 RepID=A0AAD6EG37_9EURO|nr:uncharacterized protein N7537_001724 [Penicillium hordei]KAJ5616610.1 hypothetical protein N7537_001724 [Penicillium hordei]
MTDAQFDMRSDRVWYYQMDDLSDDRDLVDTQTTLGYLGKLNMDAEYISASSASKSSSDLPTTPKTQSVAVIKQPQSGYKHCWGDWAHWKRLPIGMR